MSLVLSELKTGTRISIEAARGIKTMEFSSEVISTEGLNVRINPIMQNGKLVGFDTGGIVITMYVTGLEDGKIYKYTGVKIHSFKNSDGAIFQEVTCRGEEGKVTNRRGACRVWVGENGIATLADGKEIPVVVKDVSATGVAIVCGEDVEVTMGDVVTVSFTDGATKSKFVLTASVIRHEDADNKRIIYGCKFKQESEPLAKFVNEKQRINLKNTRTVNAAAKR